MWLAWWLLFYSLYCFVTLFITGPVKNFSGTLCQLTYITTLVIKNNNLERLPAELGNLVNLVNLDASCNRLHSLPSTIGDLTELRALILNDNKIVDLPSEIGRLLNLRHFSKYQNMRWFKESCFVLMFLLWHQFRK